MLSSIVIPGLILILIFALVIFGPSKLPEFDKTASQTLKGFKNSTKDLMDDTNDVQADITVEDKSENQSKNETKI